MKHESWLSKRKVPRLKSQARLAAEMLGAVNYMPSSNVRLLDHGLLLGCLDLVE